MSTVTPIPPGFTTVTPHLTVRGASDFIDFLKRAFGGQEMHRMAGPGGKIMHATVKIGDAMVMLNDHFPEFGSKPIPEGPFPFALHLYVEDAEATYASAVAAGAKVTMPLADQFWGDRYGQVTDPFGYLWSIATRKEIVSAEEMKERQAKMFTGHA